MKILNILKKSPAVSKKACPPRLQRCCSSGRPSFRQRRCRRGFSLLELIVAIFVFSVVMVASTVIFGSSINGYRNARVIQKDLENSQDAMNIITKTLRTSSVHNCRIAPGSWDSVCSSPPFDAIRIYDYSQSECIMYVFHIDTTSGEHRLEQRKLDPPDPDNPDNPDCSGNIYSGSSSEKVLAATGNVTGQFDVIQSSKPPATATQVVGKVTVSMEVAPDPSAAEKDKVRIQSSVSLRDYDEAGL